MDNRLRTMMGDGQAALNGWVSIGNPFVAEIMAAQGYDSLTIDAQHGALDYAAMLPMLQAMRASGVTPMVRVPWLEPGVIMKALDAGAYGIICPMVNTAKDAARFVSYMRYPPGGQRSFGPTRVNFAAGAGYADRANASLLALAMIETGEAIDNLEAIIATPGLDGVYVGPADLALGMTAGRLRPGLDREEPEMIDAIRQIASVARSNGRFAGIHCGSSEYAARAIGWGYDFVTLSNDVRILAGAARAGVDEVRAALGQARTGETVAKGGY